MKKNIVVIAGGNSSEYEVSIKSGNHIFSEVDGEKYNKYLMILRGRDWMVEIGDQKFPVDKNDFSFEYQGKKVVFDFAYITIHGNPGENGMLQGYLDMMGVPYSTCNTLVEAITFDKYTCTNYLNAFGINTTHPIMLVRGKAFDKEAVLKTVGLPCFVKPNAEGSSFGVSKVKTAADFDTAVEGAFKMCREILVESFIDGIEFTCGLYKVGDKKVVMPVAEVVPKKEFFDVVFSKLQISASKALVIGDSLTSDIIGGIQYGIDTCWFNPKKAVNTMLQKPTYEIKQLNELLSIL